MFPEFYRARDYPCRSAQAVSFLIEAVTLACPLGLVATSVTVAASLLRLLIALSALAGPEM